MTAPIAPGLLETVTVGPPVFLELGDIVAVDAAPCVLALDGEREVVVRPDYPVSIRLSGNGPLVIDLHAAMDYAQRHGLLVDDR